MYVFNGRLSALLKRRTHVTTRWTSYAKWCQPQRGEHPLGSCTSVKHLGNQTHGKQGKTTLLEGVEGGERGVATWQVQSSPSTRWAGSMIGCAPRQRATPGCRACWSVEGRPHVRHPYNKNDGDDDDDVPFRNSGAQWWFRTFILSGVITREDFL